MATSVPLTVGIEIECLLISNARDLPDSWAPFDDRKMVISALSAASPPIPVFTVDESVDYSKWAVELDISVNLNTETWQLVPDDCHAMPLEIVSRKFSLTDDDWAGEIQHVLRTLHAMYNDPARSDDYRLFVNDTCGYHVHVGMGTQEVSREYPLQTVKNLIQLTTAFERVIEELHATDRFDTRAEYCTSMSSIWFEPGANIDVYSDLSTSSTPSTPPACVSEVQPKPETEAQETPEQDDEASETSSIMSSSVIGKSPVEWCEYVADHLHSLKALQKHGFMEHTNAYSFENLTEKRYVGDGEEIIGTIEFRQHRGTLDAEEIISWVKVVASMVQFSHKNGESSRLMDLIQEKTYDPSLDALGFLQLIGVEDPVVQYYRNQLKPEAAGKERDRSCGRESSGSEWRDLALELARQRWENKNHLQVMGQIKAKLLYEEYGKTSREELHRIVDRYDGYESRVVNLRIHMDRL